MARSCFSRPCVSVHHQHHHLGKADGAQRVGDGELLELALDLGPPPQPGGVDELHRAAAIVPERGDGVAGGAGLRAGEHAILAEQSVDQGRLADIGPADDRQLQRPLALALAFRRGHRRRRACCLLVGERRKHGKKIGHAVAMLGRDRHGLAEPQREGLEDAAGAGTPLGLVRHQHHRRLAAAQPIGEMAVDRRDADARVDDKQSDVGLLQRARRLLLHARAEAAGLGLVEPGGIDDAEAQIAQRGLALAPVARHPRRVVDQRQAVAHQAIEQRRFAGVGPADDGDGQCHRASGAVT